ALAHVEHVELYRLRLKRECDAGGIVCRLLLAEREVEELVDEQVLQQHLPPSCVCTNMPSGVAPSEMRQTIAARRCHPTALLGASNPCTQRARSPCSAVWLRACRAETSPATANCPAHK